MSKALLVEPEGSYKFVPIGLLKLARTLVDEGSTVKLHSFEAKLFYIPCLFLYWW